MIEINFFLEIILGFVALFLIFYAKKRFSQAQSLFKQAESQLGVAKGQIESERRESLVRLKDELHRKRKEFELELKRERLELDRLQSRLNAKYEMLEKKDQQLENMRRDLQQKERSLSRSEDILRAQEDRARQHYNDLVGKLELVGDMSKEEARQMLVETIEKDVYLSSQKWIQKVEEETRHSAKEKSARILATTMQRYAADYVAMYTSGVVHLPNEDMKGRIIGKEGRNIKSLEMATGMEFIIEETPDIKISGFNPIRREVARRTLEKLIADGRINPTRIEETVDQCEKEIEEIIQEYGKEIVLDFNLQGVHDEMITLLGKLHFRTSFSQNVLIHCKEVGYFARMIAEELGLDGGLALRAGLLHDIGKAITAEVEGPHAIIGSDIAKRYGEDPVVINAIAAHHEEVPFTSIYGPIVCIADTISASRPGARRETLTAYIKRLEKLEEIAMSFNGVKRSYALQAGREIRIIVQEDELDDEKALLLARDVARKIEKEMNFPGQIKVNVIREKRVIEYAR